MAAPTGVSWSKLFASQEPASQKEVPVEYNAEVNGKSSSCSVCLDPLFEETRARLICAHEFCLTCILQWSKANSNDSRRCPLCKKGYTHIESHFNLDGSFVCDDMVKNLVDLMLKVAWLKIDDVEPTIPEGIQIGGRLERRSHYEYYDDQWDEEWEEEYDPENYAPSRGKAGRVQKFNSGGGCLGDYLTGTTPSTTPGRNKRNSLPKSQTPSSTPSKKPDGKANADSTGSKPPQDKGKSANAPPPSLNLLTSSPCRGQQPIQQQGRRAKRSARRERFNGQLN
eukprot:Colp12_sorted_trinity150504_noHs@8369